MFLFDTPLPPFMRWWLMYARFFAFKQQVEQIPIHYVFLFIAINKLAVIKIEPIIYCWYVWVKNIIISLWLQMLLMRRTFPVGHGVGASQGRVWTLVSWREYVSTAQPFWRFQWRNQRRDGTVTVRTN